MVNLSIILPTVGRPTLGRALQSVASQGLLPGDEVLVLADASGDWGHTPANELTLRARPGNWLLRLDDDDVYLPGAFATVRKVLAEGMTRPHVFRIRHSGAEGFYVWQRRELVEGNVSTQCFVVPNVFGKIGAWWGNRYAGDFDFIRAVASCHPEGVVWREEIIAVHNAPWQED